MATRVAPEVADALASGGAVVALESTIISHGLPRPDNLRIAREIEAAVRAEGAVPATIAVVDGEVRVGLDDDALETDRAGRRRGEGQRARPGRGRRPRRQRRHHRRGHRARWPTGPASGCSPPAGLGGVHRGASTSFDESADLGTLGRTGITVVCAGVKSILDVGATLERLESLGVTVVGMGTDRFPGFYLSDSGFPVDASGRRPSRRSPPSCAPARELGTDHAALVVANPLPVAEQVDPGAARPAPRGGPGGRRRRGRARQGRHPVPPRALPPRERRREPAGQRRHHPAQRRRWRLGSRWRHAR